MSELVETWKQAIRRYGDKDGILTLEQKPRRLPALVEAYTPPGLSCLMTSGHAFLDREGFIVVDFRMVIAPGSDSAGNPRYWLSRRLGEQARQAQHRDLYLPEGSQAQGVGRAMWSQALDLYEALGFVDLVALKSTRIGRYANIVPGLDFLKDDDRMAVATAVSTVAEAAGIHVDSTSIRRPADILAIEGTTDLETLKRSEIAFSPETRFVDPKRIPVGKAALLSEACPDWVGTLKLEPGAESYERLCAYVGRDAPSPPPDVDL